jgi:hypothetical protein
MDYIYKDSKGKKKVSSVRGLRIIPLFDFEIRVDGKWMWCQMDHTLSEWCIHFINLEKSVELAYPTDVIWNTEALYKEFGDVETSRKIAYAIKAVFEETIKR